MTTHRNSWKRRERDAAGVFGARRQVLSGSSGRDDATTSDSTHPRLYIETKLRAWSAVRTLWERTQTSAHRERKRPVLMLYTKGRRGALVVVHQDDLEAVAAELANAPGQAPEPSPWLQEAEPFPPG
ncbi:MAG: hypothetical protein ACLQGP_02935 [Isosphaeraceae bacterium]